MARPLDLVLFNSTAVAYGAHVGVHVGDDAILHLCAEVGHPVVWRAADFAARERYAVRLGAKRLRNTPDPPETGGPSGGPERRTDPEHRETDRQGRGDRGRYVR